MDLADPSHPELIAAPAAISADCYLVRDPKPDLLKPALKLLPSKNCEIMNNPCQTGVVCYTAMCG